MSLSLSLYPPQIHSSDQSPECGPDIDEACEAIREATKGWGTDESALIDVLGTKNSEDRFKISHRYEEMYGKDLAKLMKKEEGGDFGTALRLLAMPMDAMEAKLIKWSLKGLGTDEDRLYPLVCGRSNDDIDCLKKAFYRSEEKDLTERINSEVGGDLEKLLIVSLQGIEEAYDPDVHTPERVKDDATALYDAGQGKFFGSDEGGLFRILCLSPPRHLRAVNRVYAEEYGYTLFKAFEMELRSDAERAALFSLGMKLRPGRTVAKLIRDACEGMGTDELMLTSCLIRYRPLLARVSAEYERMYGKTLLEAVGKEEGGDLGKLYETIIESAIAEGDGYAIEDDDNEDDDDDNDNDNDEDEEGGAAETTERSLGLDLPEGYGLFMGNYERGPVENDWHTVEILRDDDDNLRWRNAAGAEWSMTYEDGTLKSGEDCPYGEREVAVEMDDSGHVMGLVFMTETYSRV